MNAICAMEIESFSVTLDIGETRVRLLTPIWIVSITTSNLLSSRATFFGVSSRRRTVYRLEDAKRLYKKNVLYVCNHPWCIGTRIIYDLIPGYSRILILYYMHIVSVPIRISDVYRDCAYSERVQYFELIIGTDRGRPPPRNPA